MADTTVSPNMSDDELLQEYYDEHYNNKLPATIICAVVLLLGLTGNSLTLYVFLIHYTKGKFRYFVLFLTLTDLFSCFTAIPIEMTSHWYGYPVPTICKFKAFFWAFTLFLKPACLAVISVDSYMKVCHPLGWQMTQTIAIMACIGVFILASLLALPFPIFWRILERNVEYMDRNVTVMVCDIDDRYEDPFIDKYVMVIFFLVMAALGCTEAMYIFIFVKLAIWRRVVYQRSMKKKLDSCGTKEEIDISPSHDEPTAGNISYDQTPYIVSDSDQNDVTGGESDHSNNSKVEDVLNIIYLARREVVIMIYLAALSFLVPFTHMLASGRESNGIVPSLNFIGLVVSPVVYAFRDSEFRAGIVKLKTNVVKTCRVCCK